MNTNEYETLREVRQRVTRIESRLVNLGEQLGAVMHSSNKAMAVSYAADNDFTADVELVGLDTSFSDVLHFVEKEEVADGIVRIRHKGKLIGIIYKGD